MRNKHLEELDKRERGYDRIILPDGDVTIYDDDKIIKNCVVYKGKNGKQNLNIYQTWNILIYVKMGLKVILKNFTLIILRQLIKTLIMAN